MDPDLLRRPSAITGTLLDPDLLRRPSAQVPTQSQVALMQQQFQGGGLLTPAQAHLDMQTQAAMRAQLEYQRNVGSPRRSQGTAPLGGEAAPATPPRQQYPIRTSTGGRMPARQMTQAPIGSPQRPSPTAPARAAMPPGILTTPSPPRGAAVRTSTGTSAPQRQMTAGSIPGAVGGSPVGGLAGPAGPRQHRPVGRGRQRGGGRGKGGGKE